MEICVDFIECLGPDTSTSVLMLLDDPADLLRISAVSCSWRRFVIANRFCKYLCLRMCPEASNFEHVIEVSSSKETAEVGSSTAMEWESLEREHRVYAYFSHCLFSPIGKEDCCLLKPISASSTDNYPDESIENTLDVRDRVHMRPSYWSSKGESNPGVPERLTYRLCSKLCIISEIKIRPFEAYFQYGNPIYSAKAVRFRMGLSRLSQETGSDTTDEYAEGQEIADDNYIWTYVSPEFPMAQENVLQTFKLPRPSICIGGILQIELLGRVQMQEMDDLYYLCVCHVQVIGRPLPPSLDVDILETAGCPALKYLPEGRAAKPLQRTPSPLAGKCLRAVRRWNHPILNIMLGVTDSDSEDEDEPIAFLE